MVVQGVISSISILHIVTYSRTNKQKQQGEAQNLV